VQVCTLPLYTQTCTPDSDKDKDNGLILIQLLNAVKSLQACGVEDTTASMEEFLLCSEDKNVLPRLCVLPPATDQVTYNITALIVLILQERRKLATLRTDILFRIKSVPDGNRTRDLALTR
jgi:hypothetical protein